MLKNIKLKIIAFFTQGHARTLLAKKNIAALFVIKGGNIIINLALVPLTIHYISPTLYGVWLTLSSIIAWFSFFDIGFGNGLRNKFAEALALGQKDLARIYVSTTYAILSIIIAVLLLAFIAINPLLNWAKILNTPPEVAEELSTVALVVFVFFCLQFVLKLIATVIVADQKPAKAAFFDLMAGIISLITIFILTNLTKGRLLYLSFALSVSPVLILLLSSIWFYNREYKYYAPAFRFVKFSYVKGIMNLGLKFFIIQISVVILFSTDNMIITQIFGPERVVPYNIAYKYFSVTNMIYSIIIFPYWSGITEAYTKEDYTWIKNSMRNLIKLTIPFFFLIVIMLFMANTVYYYWVGDSVPVPTGLSVLMGIYWMTCIFLSPFTFFINGTGKVKIQLILCILGALINVPVSSFFAIHWGIKGVILGTIICLLPGTILVPIQYYKIINKKASGIWNQ